MNVLYFSVLAVTMLAGCAAPVRPAMQGEKDDALVAYTGCLRPVALQLDDGISDPRAIADAMAGVCSAQFEAVAQVLARGEDAGFYRQFRARRNEFQRRIVGGIVLKGRSAKTGPPPNS